MYHETATATIPQSLRVDEGCEGNLGVARCLRALSGGVVLVCPDTGGRYRLTRNFFAPDQSHGSAVERMRVAAKSLGDTGITLRRLSAASKKYKAVNRSFYSDLAAEIALCLVNRGRSDHISSFIYLYRSIETIAYAFPSIYASNTSDFSKSFGELSKLFAQKESEGELSFFAKFVTSLNSDDQYEKLFYEMNFSHLDADGWKNIRNTLKKIAGRNLDKNVLAQEDIGVISIKFEYMPSFIISVRNRYFHYKRTREENLNHRDLPEPQYFFASVVEVGLTFFALLFLIIVEKGMPDLNV